MSKITKDPIHGTIELSNILFMIIDTPQFQRLRNIKQLGGCYFLYPGASHNRFEHSIGVCYLAGKLARHLKNDINRMKVDERTQEIASQINMTDDDVMCIEIAGLCHDLGHGPYSHLFDVLFQKAMQKKSPDANEWKHEDVSKEMFRHMLNANKSLNTEFCKKFGKEKEKRIEFILNLITGKIPEEEIPERKCMYEIVANHRNEIDVDKMDYFARDGQALGIKYSFDHDRYFANCRVMFIPDSNETTIAVRDKEIFNLYELFHTRLGLFRRAYYHKVTKAVELMATDALVAANDVIEIKSSDGNVKMDQAYKLMPAYQMLTDSIFDIILMKGVEVEDAGLKKATQLINRIYSRKLYELVLETVPNPGVSEEDVEKFILGHSNLTADDFTVQKVVFNYGMKEKDPITEVYFFKKEENICYIRNNPAEISLFLPSKTFQEEFIRVYSKRVETKEDLKKITTTLEGNNIKELIQSSLLYSRT